MRGVTIIEIILVIAFFISLSAATVSIYGVLHGSTQLNEVVSQFVQAIRIAQIRSTARLNDANHGVYLNTLEGVSSYTLYEGQSYLSRNLDKDRLINLESVFSISADFSGGGTDINFSKGLGQPNVTGAILIKHANSGFRTITINKIGTIGED